MNPLYGGRPDFTPAYIHVIITTLYIRGASHFVGGSSRFADLLASVVISHGGQVLPGDGVEWIEVNDRHVDFVRTHSGKQYISDYYISDVHPCNMLELMDKRAFPKSYRNRLNDIPNTHSAFSLYVKLKPGTFPYFNHTEYYMTHYNDVWQCSRTDKPWPLGFLLMTPPVDHQGPFARKVLVTAPMPFEMVERWKDTTVGHRGVDYELWKQQKAEELLTHIDIVASDYSRLLCCEGGQHLWLCKEL